MVARMLRRVCGLAGRRCQLCAAVLPATRDCLVCADCARLLVPRQAGFCPRCGICFSDPESPVYTCGACRTSPPPWRQVAFHSPYDGVLKGLVHRYKFGCELGVGWLLGELLHAAWLTHGGILPDVLVPVPMRLDKLVRRGFNQSAELARMLAWRLDVPLAVDAISKIRATAAQSRLGRAERLRNVVGAFVASSRLAGRRVLLVDDVLTTGATMTACARACLDAGATSVDVAVLGRAL